jgi:predicted transglutaminase-like cysteine proteinase
VNAKDIRKIDTQVRKKFTYKLDDGDHWRSFAAAVKAGTPWQGDCDDLATTTIQLLYEAGAHPKTLCRACVSSKRDKRIDHMIAFAKDDAGQIWVVGDTFGPAYPIENMNHRPILISLVTKGIAWVQVTSVDDIKKAFSV